MQTLCQLIFHLIQAFDQVDHWPDHFHLTAIGITHLIAISI